MIPADLERFVESHRRVAIDTSPLIYWLEKHPRYFELSKHIFDLTESNRVQTVTSTLTLTEVLVLPYRKKDWENVHRIYVVLDNYPHLEWIPPTLEIAGQAARIRAAHNLKTPDAIQAATAILSGSTGFISNDPIFRRVPSLDVLILDEMLQ